MGRKKGKKFTLVLTLLAAEYLVVQLFFAGGAGCGLKGQAKAISQLLLFRNLFRLLWAS